MAILIVLGVMFMMGWMLAGIYGIVVLAHHQWKRDRNGSLTTVIFFGVLAVLLSFSYAMLALSH